MRSSFEARPWRGGRVLTRSGLAGSSDPVALVPGDAAALRALAVGLRRLAVQGLVPLVSGLAAAGSAVGQSWHGQAGEAASAVVAGQRVVADSCSHWAAQAANELEGYAQALVAAQLEAAAAAADYRIGEVLTQNGDPWGGAGLCAAAVQRLDRARWGLDERAAGLAAVLRRVAGRMPQEPSVWADPAWHAVKLFGGVVDTVSLPFVVASTLDPSRAGEDPSGYWQDLTSRPPTSRRPTGGPGVIC